MTFSKKAGIAVGLLAAVTLSAHFAWIDAPTLTVGKTAKIRIGNGHDLGKSESALSLDGLKAWSLAPSGAKADLKFTADGNWLTADFSVKEAGAHRFVMVQDRGVFSQTTKGFKAGGRDVNPDAKKATKYWRSGLAYGSTDSKQAPAKPLGLELELTAVRAGNDIHLTVYRAGKPFAGAKLAIGLEGVADDQEIGKSDANGKFTYQVASGKKGPAVFLAVVLNDAPKGSNFDVSNHTAAAYLNW